MPLHDLHCTHCDATFVDFFFRHVPDVMYHFPCGGELEIEYAPRVLRGAQWSDKSAVVVFRDPKTEQIRYPGRNDVKTPVGYERVVMRSLREVERFEKEHHVRNEAVWYDRGSGCGGEEDFS